MPKGGKEKFHQNRDSVGVVTLTKKDTESAKNLDRHRREVNSKIVEDRGEKVSPRSRRRISNEVASSFNTLDHRFPLTKAQPTQVTPGKWKTSNIK